MNNYNLKIKGLKEGLHSFSFNLKDPFFRDFPETEIIHANILVGVLLDKSYTKQTLTIKINGEINHLLCDICAEDLSVTISSNTEMLIKETNEELETTDDIIYIHPNDHEFSIKHLLFELIVLSLPNKRRHKTNKDGKLSCSKEMIKLIDKYSNIKNPIYDKRWDKLKDLEIK